MMFVDEFEAGIVVSERDDGARTVTVHTEDGSHEYELRDEDELTCRFTTRMKSSGDCSYPILDTFDVERYYRDRNDE